MVGIVLVGTVALSASAFTAATVDRRATVDVVADENGLLALIDGNSGDLVFQDRDTEQLGIDFSRNTAQGANVNAIFELGNPDDPTSSNAFKIQNRDDEQHRIDVAYTGASTNTEENLNISIYDDDGTRVGSVTEEGTTASFTAPASTDSNSNTFYTVVSVDTGGGRVTTDLSSASDLSGVVSFSIDDGDTDDTGSDRNSETAPSPPTDDTGRDGTLTVDRVRADADGNDYDNLNDEYVVFENTGDSSLDISGWTVTDEVDHTYTVPDGVSVDAGDTLTLRTGSGPDGDGERYWGSGSPIWNNGGDTVTVRDDSGHTVIEHSYQ
jgi:hypothetical protein